ncbi:hypothetical protein L3V79_06665 [Thiotrichales bacterium 19S9-12]|nr:hypothetical protein [Thiotrichales bacterium 19S9-11]MCF6812036.1 hypothetical protein [Thiotrichales bacterium 19S9-12]
MADDFNLELNNAFHCFQCPVCGLTAQSTQNHIYCPKCEIEMPLEKKLKHDQFYATKIKESQCTLERLKAAEKRRFEENLHLEKIRLNRFDSEKSAENDHEKKSDEGHDLDNGGHDNTLNYHY